MKALLLLLAAATALAACSKPGAAGQSKAEGGVKLGPKDGAWSERQALEGPMALWGPPGLGKEAIALTCLPQPRRGLVVTLFPPALPAEMAGGELMLRVDGKGVGVPLTAKDEGAFEARLPAAAATIKSLSHARSIRFEVKAAAPAGADTGPAGEPLKRVLAACG